MSGISDAQGVSADPIVLAIDGPVARITLNRPRERNALSRALLLDLEAALDICAARSDLRIVVLGGNGPAFSAGHDLREIRSASPDAIADLFALCARVMLKLQEVMNAIRRLRGVQRVERRQRLLRHPRQGDEENDA